MNIIIFGGSFDPVHNGHINMAISAKKTLCGDVFFVPAPVSVWKDSSAPIQDKINMLKLAIKGQDGLFIDTFEVDTRKKINYSIDTVKYFHQKYPSAKLFYLIGADQVNEFHRWKDAEELSKLASIAYFGRPDIVLTNENATKFHMMNIPGNEINVSSNEIRNLKSLELPEQVLDYILTHRLYYVNQMTKFISDKRLNHSISVAKLAYEIAKRNKFENPDKVFVAALLHDIGKLGNLEKEKEIVRQHFKEYLDMPSFSYHQFAGAYIAKEQFGIRDKSILNAIMFHATGNQKMDQIGKIVYASDKIEPTRNFDSTNLINAMMEDVDKGFVEVLKANKEYLENNKKEINNRLTSSCFNYYL